MMIRGYVRTIKTGNPVPDGTEVEIRRHVDNSLIATVVTVGGLYEYVQDGSPGPYYVRVDISDEVHISSSKVVGMSGSVDISGLHLYFRLWRDGYIPNVMEQSSVFSSGAGMQVTVRSGVHLIRGVLYDQPGHVNLAIDAADSQPRIDTVVIEVMRPGSGDNVEGRTRLVVKKGTPAATPTAPSLTQTSGGVWEHPIANVTVDPAVSSIASNKVTDRRTRCNVEIPAGSITGTHIADNSIETNHIKNATILEEDLHADVVAKLNAGPATPSIAVERNTTKTNFPSAGTLLTSSRTLAAGTYTWFAHGTLRVTGEASSTLVRGWLRILRNGSEQNAEPFYTTADAFGVSVDVMAGGTFTHTGGAMPIVLDWTRDSGVATANSRQLFTFVQKIS